MLDNGSKPLRIGQTPGVVCAFLGCLPLLSAGDSGSLQKSPGEMCRSLQRFRKCSLLERVNELRPFSSMFCDMFIAGNFRAAAMYFKNRVIRVVPKTVRLYTEHRMASF